MKHFPNRAISLILAVVFLFSAAGVSFLMLFQGTTVYADSGDEPPSFTPIFYLSGNQEHTGSIYPNTTINRLEIEVYDPELIAENYNVAYDEMKSSGEGKKLFSSYIKASLNTDNFQQSSQKPVFSPKATSSSKGGSFYTITFSNLKYIGNSNSLNLSITYPTGSTEYPFPPNRSMSTQNHQLVTYSIESRPEGGNNSESSSSRPDIAPPTPTVIISNFDYGGGTVKAASNFSLKLTMTNTSKKLPIDNIVMKVSVPEAFTMNGSTNTFYIEKMGKNATEQRTLELSVKPGAEPISHPIKISFTFEAVIDEARKQYTAEQEISIPVGQLDRFSMNPVEVPPEIYVGEDMSFEVTFVNKGKTTIYNISAEIAGNLSQPGQRQFVGNLDGGKEDSVDFLIGAIEGGPVAGEVILTYEDANMNVTELRSAFNTNAIQMDQGNAMTDMEVNQGEMPPEEPQWYQKFPIWGWMIGGVVLIIFAAFAVRIVRTRREKKQEEQDADF